MKTLKKTTLAFLFVLTIYACNQHNEKLNDATVPADTALIPNNSDELLVDKNFFEEAMQGSMVEIELGNLAMKNAKNKNVKDYGEMMVIHHTKIYQELKVYFSSKNEEIIDSLLPENNVKYQSLLVLKGDMFDAAYLKMMKEDHQSAIELYNNMAERGFDPEVKKWAKTKIKTLEEHLIMAEELTAK